MVMWDSRGLLRGLHRAVRGNVPDDRAAFVPRDQLLQHEEELGSPVRQPVLPFYRLEKLGIFLTTASLPKLDRYMLQDWWGH